MDWSAITTAIGSIGFPIVACCGMFYLYNNTINNLIISLAKIDSTLNKVCQKLELEE